MLLCVCRRPVRIAAKFPQPIPMLQDPNMQKLLYPYLPEGMRNPETFQWMMNSPEYRVQLEELLNKQVSWSTPTPVLMHVLQFFSCWFSCTGFRAAAIRLLTLGPPVVLVMLPCCCCRDIRGVNNRHSVVRPGIYGQRWGLGAGLRAESGQQVSVVLCLSWSVKHDSQTQLENAEQRRTYAFVCAVQGTFDPGMMGAVQNSDLDMDNINEKLKDMNLTPEQIIQKMMSEPALAQVRVQDL